MKKNTFIEKIINEYKNEPLLEYKIGEIIFYEEQPCEYVSFILKGTIYMSTFFNDKEINFNYMKKGNMFGHNLIFNDSNKYQAHVIALEKTKILNISKDNFLKSLMKYDLLEEYLNLISKITLEDKEQIKILKISKLRDRITYILCKNKGIYRFKNITYFASYLGTSRENLSREITKMEQENIIVRSKNTLRLICNCCEN